MQSQKPETRHPAADPLVECVPPNSIEAEMAVLGAMIIDSGVIGEVIETVEAKDFYRDAHRLIFEAVQALFLTQRSADLVILVNKLQELGTLDRAGGTEYLMTLVEQVPLAANAAHYAKVVRDKAVVRQLLAACQTIRNEATQVHEDPDELLDKAQRLIFETAARKDARRMQFIGPSVREAFEAVTSNDRKERCLGIPTGYFQLDELTSGLQRAQLYVLAARPSVGKTSLAMCIAERVCVDQRTPALFFSLEMSSQAIAQKMLAVRARVDSQKMQRGTLTEDDQQKLIIAAGRLYDAPLIVDDTSDLGVMELRAKARRMKAEHDVQLVIVDYLQLVRSRAESREREVALVSAHLKALAKDLDVPVVVLSQLNRKLEERADKRPSLADLRESGSIEQDADVVLLMARDVMQTADSAPGICDVIVAKNRTGPTGELRLAFLAPCTRFENLKT